MVFEVLGKLRVARKEVHVLVKEKNCPSLVLMKFIFR